MGSADENAIQLRSRSLQPLNVQKNVRLGVSLPAALLYGVLISRGIACGASTVFLYDDLSPWGIIARRDDPGREQSIGAFYFLSHFLGFLVGLHVFLRVIREVCIA